MKQEREYAVEMRGISKAFHGTKALNDVTLLLKKGSVHALMGENGAGKSTLMKILAGIYKNDTGELILDGRSIRFADPHDAIRNGIAMIHQELNFIPEMTIAENMFLGSEFVYRGKSVVNFQKMTKEAAKLLEQVGLDLHPSTKMKHLTVAQAQMVEIAKAIGKHAAVLIMDEPTSAITDREVDILFGVIRKLKEEGRSIIYITHKMDEVFRISDEITVLRDGTYIGTYEARRVDTNQLIKLMIDRELTEVFPVRSVKPGKVKFRVQGLTAKNLFRDVSFEVHRGEILGLAGLMGAGRTEVVESIFGVRRLDAGEIYVDGQRVKIRTPSDAIRHSIGLVTEDRKSSGLVMTMNIKENMTLVTLPGLSKFRMVVDGKKEERKTVEQSKTLNIKARGLRQTAEELSGGNQQKVILAKWIMAAPDILMLDEPTRGIDVGAKMEIYHLISKLAEEGKTILFISSEMQEILGMCDRVVVFHEGRISGELSREEATQEKVLKLATNVM